MASPEKPARLSGERLKLEMKKRIHERNYHKRIEPDTTTSGELDWASIASRLPHGSRGSAAARELYNLTSCPATTTTTDSSKLATLIFDNNDNGKVDSGYTTNIIEDAENVDTVTCTSAAAPMASLLDVDIDSLPPHKRGKARRDLAAAKAAAAAAEEGAKRPDEQVDAPGNRKGSASPMNSTATHNTRDHATTSASHDSRDHSTKAASLAKPTVHHHELVQSSKPQSPQDSTVPHDNGQEMEPNSNSNTKAKVEAREVLTPQLAKGLVDYSSSSPGSPSSDRQAHLVVKIEELTTGSSKGKAAMPPPKPRPIAPGKYSRLPSPPTNEWAQAPAPSCYSRKLNGHLNTNWRAPAEPKPTVDWENAWKQRDPVVDPNPKSFTVNRWRPDPVPEPQTSGTHTPNVSSESANKQDTTGKRGKRPSKRTMLNDPANMPASAQKNGWIKSSAIKVEKDRWKMTYSTPTEDSLDRSSREDSEWNTRKKRAEETAWFHAEKGEHDLINWDGGLAPPPCDWDNRLQFSEGHNTESVTEWTLGVVRALSQVKQPDPMAVVDGLTFDVQQGDIAPRYWLPDTIGEITPAVLWHEVCTRNHAPLLDEEDIVDAKPWWETYQNKKGCFLKPYEQPLTSGNDPSETEPERLARENDMGDINVIENRRAAAKAKKEAHRARQLKKQERIRVLSQHLPAPPPKPAPLRPSIPRLYVRSATKDDMVQVQKLYNHYVDHSLVAPELRHRTVAHMESRLLASQSADLPFIVALQRGKLIKPRGKKNLAYTEGNDLQLPDEIVGYAHADDWHDLAGMCKYTATLEVYVHQAQTGRGVGSCLLDKAMALLDPIYPEKGGFETVGIELDGAAPMRFIQNVIIQYYYDAASPERLGWVDRWMTRVTDFEQNGDLPGVGHKFDKFVNLALFQKTTGAKIVD